jgi:hypothetical protein
MVIIVEFRWYRAQMLRRSPACTLGKEAARTPQKWQYTPRSGKLSWTQLAMFGKFLKHQV